MGEPGEPLVIPLAWTPRLVFAVVCLVFVALLFLGVAFAGFMSVTGAAQRLGLAVAGLAIVGATVWVLIALGKRAIVLDGSRIGWRNGFVAAGSWTEREGIVVTTRNASGPRGTNLVLWSRAGGMRGINTMFARFAMMPADRARLKAATRSERLRPFVVPLTDLGAEGAAEVEAWLARR